MCVCVCVCLCVCVYIFDTLGHIVNLEQIEFYRDDRIIFIRDKNGPNTSKIKKMFIGPFKLQGMRIERVSKFD